MNLDYNLNDTSRFNARCSAIIYNKDKTKILVFKIEDGRDYYMLPGGRIEFNESSIDSIKREIKEELGYHLDFQLTSIQENFVTKNDIQIMQYAFCFKSIYLDEIENNEFKCLDNDFQMFYWININEIDKYKIVPNSSINLIKKDDMGILHLIERQEL